MKSKNRLFFPIFLGGNIFIVNEQYQNGVSPILQQVSPGDIGGQMFDQGIDAEVKKRLGWFSQRHFDQTHLVLRLELH